MRNLLAALALLSLAACPPSQGPRPDQGRGELYDLVDDPGESVDRAAVAPQSVQQLRDALAAQARDTAPTSRDFPDAFLPSTDEARRLEELGYVEEGT